MLLCRSFFQFVSSPLQQKNICSVEQDMNQLTQNKFLSDPVVLHQTLELIPGAPGEGISKYIQSYERSPC